MDDVDEEDEDDEQDDDEQGESGMEEEDDVYDDGHGNEQYGLDQIDRMVDDMEEDEYSDEDQDMPQFNSSVPSSGPTRQSFSRSRQSDVRGSDRLRQSKEDGVLGFRRSLENPKAQDSMFAGLAKEMYTQMGIPRVNEADDFVLETENLVIRLYEEGIGASEDEDALKRALALIPGELLKLWSDYNNRTLAHVSEEYATAIGPGPRASKFAHANFIASLLIRLRHPTPLAVANSGSQPFRGSLMRGSIAPALEGKVKPIPLLLLEWMDDYHDPYPSQLDEIQAHRPSPANHRLFWDTILNSLLRGRVVAVVNALKTAGWKHARAATEDVRDDSDETEYSGLALSNIEKVINDALQVLQYCPAMRGDWDIRNSDWTLFRLRISQALENLRRFAEGRDRNRDTSDSFEAENFGLSAKATGGQSYSGIAKKAQSKVPWSIYQNLLTMYNLMLGDANAIIGNSEDWCEATIGLVVWWDQGKDDRRLSHGRLRASVEGNDFEVYFRKLAESFYCATSESTDFQVNTLDAIEIGLASVFESDIEAVIGILRSWSGPVSSAVAEIASLGGWLPGPEPQNLIAMDSLDQDDMDLLGISGSSELIDNVKDYTLIVYAEGLARRGQMESSPTFGHPKTVREGWELAIEVLGRLDSATRSEDEVGRLLSGVPLDSGATVDKLWRLLNELGMTKHAENVAEVC